MAITQLIYTLKDINEQFVKLTSKEIIKNSIFKLDSIQQQSFIDNLHDDINFRRATQKDYTMSFIEVLKDSAKIREPIHLNVTGKTRSGKSYIAITICIIHSLLNGRVFTEKYICSNQMDYLEKLRTMTEEELINSIFLIDEQKKDIFSSGSLAKKFKLQDVQNIIAINNISTISLTPFGWSNENAYYGLRTFGRCFENGITRLMFYDLQEGDNKRRGLPKGFVYLPIFTKILPPHFAEQLEKQYLKQKNQWVNDEREGRGDVLAELRRKRALEFLGDPQFNEITKKAERFSYIQMILGSEFTKAECEEILNLANMMERGVIFQSKV